MSDAESPGRSKQFVAVLLLGIVLGSTATAAYFVANPETEIEYRTEYQTIKKPVSNQGIVFTIDSGYNEPPDWGYPVTVEFQRANETSWQTQYLVSAFERDPFVVGLNRSTRYRIVATPPSGEARVLGVFTPEHANEPVELMVSRCCVDDFGSGDSNE